MTAKQKAHKCKQIPGWWIVTMLLLTVPRCVFAIQTTQVQGVVYRADGTIAQGTIIISWPPFTAADGSTIAAGSTSTTIAGDGTVSLALAPNGGANPAGTYYTVVYHMTDGTVQREYWVVPQATSVTVSEMRSRVVPASVAQQTVSQQYVDASISGLQSSYLQLKGGTMSGVLNLSADPTSALQAATKEYVDAHAGAQLPPAQDLIAGSGNGGAVALPEKGVSVSGSNGSMLWDDDLGAGIYDPRDPRWAGGINGPTPAAAAQAMSNQMACDLAMGKVRQAIAKWPQGTYYVDELQIAPGSSWEGARSSTGGTTLHTQYYNHYLAQAMPSMTVTCSDGNTYTDTANNTHVSHFNFQGCAEGSCSNPPGDTTFYNGGGPHNTGLEMGSTGGVVEYVSENGFGGYGLKVDGQDTKVFHVNGGASGGNLSWYYYGNYKGYGESTGSPEASATTTGTTSSISLSWTAVTNAGGTAAPAYAVYRGSSSGKENAFFITTTNAFTDTGAAGHSGTVNTVSTEASGYGIPGTMTATASATGGTLAAGTYYYVVTALTNDGWHGSVEISGTDVMADWIEQYGFFDAPTAFNYHHLADIVLGGGIVYLNHAWPQRGQVGIAVPYGGGGYEHIENARVDFANLEGIWIADYGTTVTNSELGSSCSATNAQALNSGSGQGVNGWASLAGMCDQLFAIGAGDHFSNVQFNVYGGFGPAYNTGDYFIEDSNSTATNMYGTPDQNYAFTLFAGAKFDPSVTLSQKVTGPTPNVQGFTVINPNDSSATTYTGFLKLVPGQTLFVQGGNANVTLANNTYLKTCNGENLNLGNYPNQYLEFVATGQSGVFGFPMTVYQVCNVPGTIGSSETVSFSATPTFSVSTRTSQITLGGNVTSFTLGTGGDGQEKTLVFCNDATGGYTVGAPANVRGFFTVGTAASKCSSQHFTYSAARSAWMADSPGVTNE